MSLRLGIDKLDKISFGKIVKPHGLKGEVKVLLSTNQTQFLANLKYAYIGENDIPVKVEKSYIVGKFVIIKFFGISSFEQADKLRGLVVAIERKDFVLPQDNFLVEDLIGSTLYDEKNVEIGKLIEVLQYGAADVFVVWADGREYSFPFIKEVVLKVLPQQKVIIVSRQKFDEVKICE